MKSKHPTRSLPSQLIIGAFMIGLGVLFLLDNLNIVDFHRALSFWPVVFILAGVAKLLDSRSPNSTLFGAGLIGFGIILILKRMDILDVHWSTIWPLFWIGLGALIVYKAFGTRRSNDSKMVSDLDSDSTVAATAILGGFERRITTPNFQGGEATAMMGGCVLDLRGSSIQGEAVINVFAMMGGIELKVPPDWTVIIQGTPIMGGFEEKTIAPPDNSKRLIVKGYAIMGGVDVHN